MSAEPTNLDIAPQGLNVDRLNDWLAPRLEVDAARLSYLPLTAGRSNLTYVVKLDGVPRWVLRRPPLGHRGASAHDVTRESRIFSALESTGVPVPRIVAVADESGPLQVPFFVMSHVDGMTLESADDFETIPLERRPDLAGSMMAALAQIHAIDVERVGLGDLKRAEPLVDRQLRRWVTNIDRLAGQECLRASDAIVLREVHQLLSIRKPDQVIADALCHGDYKPNNLIFKDGDVQAVLDWELAAVGDPGLDLGWLTVIWSHELTRKWAPRAEAGYPTSDQLVQLYETHAPRIGQLEFYQGFALWKLACIRADVNARLATGAMADLDVEARTDDPVVEQLARAAADLITD